ncbi:MAG: hypothetical protein HY699_12910 [Deltaproteobacteria bacterium]|nr:hypothetical protein [Deltaproteobacteria bacterium]
MRTRLVIIGTALLNVALLALSAPASAQRAAEARIADPQLAASLAHKSLTLLNQGEDSYEPEAKARFYREGLDLARQAVAADDTNADAHFALFATMGRVMLAEGVTPNPLSLLKVNRELDRALELNPKHYDALAARGGLYRQLPMLLGGSLAKAERYLLEAIANEPNAVGARIELARTYQDMGQVEKAITPLQLAAALAEKQGKLRQLNEARALLRNLDRAKP